jgi:hypothetical protein
MGRRPKPESTPEWTRVQAVLRVQAGEIDVTEACRQMGISRPHYYEMEARVVGAALSAASPRKPGPREKERDLEMEALAEKLRQAQRERELLELKVKHLEEVNEAIHKKVLGEAEKKTARRRRTSAVPGTSLPGRLQEDGLGPGPVTAGGENTRAGRLPGTGHPQDDVLRMAEEGAGAAEATRKDRPVSSPDGGDG